MNLLVMILILFSITQNHFISDAAAACEGSVTFYWTEKGEERIANRRNWGLLEEKLEDRKYKKLKEYFNPKNVYAYTVEGNCCWEIYGKEFFRKPSHKLKKGFSGIPDYPQFNVNSMKKKTC